MGLPLHKILGLTEDLAVVVDGGPTRALKNSTPKDPLIHIPVPKTESTPATTGNPDAPDIVVVDPAEPFIPPVADILNSALSTGPQSTPLLPGDKEAAQMNTQQTLLVFGGVALVLVLFLARSR